MPSPDRPSRATAAACGAACRGRGHTLGSFYFYGVEDFIFIPRIEPTFLGIAAATLCVCVFFFGGGIGGVQGHTVPARTSSARCRPDFVARSKFARVGGVVPQICIACGFRLEAARVVDRFES